MRQAITITGVILFLPGIYFLSYGPMTAWYYVYPIDFNLLYVEYWYETVYAPVDWLYSNTSLDGPIDWYEELWYSIIF